MKKDVKPEAPVPEITQILYSKDAVSNSHIQGRAFRRKDGSTVVSVGQKFNPAIGAWLSIKQLKNLVARAEAFEKEAVEAEKKAAEAAAAKAARKAKRDAQKAAKANEAPAQ